MSALALHALAADRERGGLKLARERAFTTVGWPRSHGNQITELLEFTTGE